MKNYRKGKVLLLPVPKKEGEMFSDMIMKYNSKLYDYGSLDYKFKQAIPNYIYVIDNQHAPIGVGDLCYDTVGNDIFICTVSRVNSLLSYSDSNEFVYIRKNCKKVLATNDSTRKIPNVSESFIKAFVKSNGKITDVLVEQEDITMFVSDERSYVIYNPKLKDNTIVIHKVKKSDSLKIVLDRKNKLKSELATLKQPKMDKDKTLYEDDIFEIGIRISELELLETKL